jgi:hypothetical protein
MVDPKIHFGLGAASKIDSINICWPDGKAEHLAGIGINQVITLDHRNSETRHITTPVRPVQLFTGTTENTKIQYRHEERQFIDFDIQPLVPHLYSKEGPGIAVGDINSDGLEDFFAGGSTGYPGMLFFQQKNGTFSRTPLPDNNNYEDMGACLFDADGDGDNDLYVVSGGSGLPPGNDFYADRLYVNDGHGNFTHDRSALPDERVCGSQVTAADFDRDGDLDLFVCGRVNLENYPMPPRSFLLRNDTKGKKVKFTDITASVSGDLEKPGLVAAALWTDFDRDGWTDLILAGEWMPLTFFRNIDGRLTNVTSQTGLSTSTGWWNSLAGADFDGDGDMDYVAGNLGLNTQYKVSQSEPMRMVAKDFDMNGSLDPVCTYFVQGKEYPIYHRNLLLSQIPSLRQKFKTYTSYAKASFSDIFSDSDMKGAYIRDLRYSASAWIENLGNGRFSLHELPEAAQISPVFGIVTGDYNDDGRQDIILTGNSYSSNIYTGQYDASIGLYLAGDGKGGFTSVPGRESGFFAPGDTKGTAELTMADGSSLLLIAANSDTLRVIRPMRRPGGIIAAPPDAVSAELTFTDGHREYREFYYGSGYLTQSTRSCRISGTVSSMKFFDRKGASHNVSDFTPGTHK